MINEASLNIQSTNCHLLLRLKIYACFIAFYWINVFSESGKKLIWWEKIALFSSNAILSEQVRTQDEEMKQRATFTLLLFSFFKNFILHRWNNYFILIHFSFFLNFLSSNLHFHSSIFVTLTRKQITN